MNADFLARLSAATDRVRQRDITGATRTIQSALKMHPDAGLSREFEENPATLRLEGEVLEADHSELPRAGATAGQRPRRRLADVVRFMQKLDAGSLRKPDFLAASTAKRIIVDPLPSGASFTTHAFVCEAGERRYKLYKPSADDGQFRALLVMLHGCTQNPDDFAVGTRMNHLAHEYGILIAYPEQASTANQLKCWNWFNPNDQRRDRGEPSIIAGLTKQIMGKHNIDPRRVYVAGLSSGGAMAAILGANYPDIYSAVGVHSGLPQGAAFDVPSAFEAMRKGHCNRKGRQIPTRMPRSIIFHGDADSTVHPDNGKSLFQAACEPGDIAIKTSRSLDTSKSSYTTHRASAPDGTVIAEYWELHGGAHAWSGGDAQGTYVDPQGPCASTEMLRFFLREAT